jgi:hypothetical protein
MKIAGEGELDRELLDAALRRRRAFSAALADHERYSCVWAISPSWR